MRVLAALPVPLQLLPPSWRDAAGATGAEGGAASSVAAPSPTAPEESPPATVAGTGTPGSGSGGSSATAGAAVPWGGVLRVSGSECLHAEG